MAMQSSGWRICFLIGLVEPYVNASPMLPTRLYEVVTVTGMPHLEENLRYTVTREKRCLTDEDLSSAFPILAHASLAGCALRPESREGETISYRLVCEGGRETTGSATWRLAERALHGTLHVKLSGKNMTFFQRVTATALGECSEAAKTSMPTSKNGKIQPGNDQEVRIRRFHQTLDEYFHDK
jgi:hypothetical protein